MLNELTDKLAAEPADELTAELNDEMLNDNWLMKTDDWLTEKPNAELIDTWKRINDWRATWWTDW